MVEELEKITEEMLLQQHQRILVLGTIKIITDVETGKAYIVPRDLTHEKFAKELKKTGATSALVPSYINLEENRYGPFKITGLLTGLSGMETGGKRHKYEDLEKAHQKVWSVIRASSPPLEICIKTDVIETKYAL